MDGDVKRPAVPLPCFQGGEASKYSLFEMLSWASWELPQATLELLQPQGLDLQEASLLRLPTTPPPLPSAILHKHSHPLMEQGKDNQPTRPEP